MKLHLYSKKFIRATFLFFCYTLFSSTTFAQQTQTKITDYVIFGGQKDFVTGQTTPLAPGYAVQLGSSCTILGGSIGSYTLVKSTGN